jgi:hypothetical protein
MTGTKGVGRLGAVGVVTAMAVAGGVVAGPSAPVPDVTISNDGMTLAAATDFDISIWGIDLFHSGSTAHATSVFGSMAFAFGDNSTAIAGGVGDTAFANGGGLANAGYSLPGQFDTAFANGVGSVADSGYGNFDSAFANGAASDAIAAGNSTNLSDGDFASAFGPHTGAVAGSFGSPSANDLAMVFDPFGTLGSTAEAGSGSFDLSSIVGDDDLAHAGFGGSSDVASVFGDHLSSLTAVGHDFLSDFLNGLI